MQATHQQMYLSDDTDDETSSNPTQTPPSSPPRSTKRQATMNSWLGHQQKTSDSQSTTNQRPLLASQPNVTSTVNSSRVDQTNTRQATMSTWLNQNTQRRPRSQTSSSSEENASPSQQQHEPRCTNNTHPNPRRTPRDLATLNSALASEGSQIFKRRRLK